MMKRYLPIAIVLAVFLPIILSPSCANTTQAPSGGKKDTIPPFITMITPLPGALNVPCNDARIIFDFSEYISVKNPQNVFLSPPLQKPVKTRVKGKSLIVSFDEPLLPQTTYTLNFTDAIADNNEGNIFPGYTYVFSTGNSVDSLYITGTVQDCNTLEPIKGATVMLYKDHSDSAVFLQRPYAAVKTDDWGFFALPYIQDTLYRLYAIVDNANNNLYDPDDDKVAFIDTLIRPSNIVNDTVPELLKYDMTDTLSCQKRYSEYELNVFREKPSRQFIKNTVRVNQRTSYITFNAEYAWIDTLWMAGYASDKVITQFNRLQDSLEIWLNDRRTAPDTLKLLVNYRKTDTLGRLEPFLEEVKLYEEGAGKNVYSKRKKASEIQHKDTICNFTVTAKGETVEQNGFEIEFALPLVNASFDSLTLRSVSPKQAEQFEKFTVEPDSMNIRRFVIRPDLKYLAGYEYILKVPHKCFRDINGFYSDSTEVKVSLPQDETLSTLKLDLSGVGSRYIVDLLDSGGKQVLRTYVIDSDGILDFPYLKAAKYLVRFTEDFNRNSIVDTGNLLEHRQCEPVKFLKVGDGKLLDIPESSEIIQTVNISELFNR